MTNIKYNTIGEGYNQTRKADSTIVAQLLNLLNLKANGQYVDIGCGTGNYTRAVHQGKYHFIGIDPSEKMLTVARGTNTSIDWRLGIAEDTGLPDTSIDGIMATLTIHHWQNLPAAFQELYRILKPGGKLVLFTSTPKQMKQYWLNTFFPEMMKMSIQQMPDETSVCNELSLKGFTEIETIPFWLPVDLEDKFLYCGKHDPSLYLDPVIRNGISSFADLAVAEEISNGIKALQKAIEGNTIRQLIKEAENNLGDYLFITAKK